MPPDPDRPARHPPASTATAAAGVAVVVALAFLVPAVAMILGGVERGPQFADEAEYHRPAVARFATEWPAFDLAASRAAMTPGYHLAMAALHRATGGDVRLLRLATAAVTAGLLATLAWAVARRARAGTGSGAGGPTAAGGPPAARGRSGAAVDAVLLCLPAAWSPYVFSAGVYVVPHNLSWWAVLGGLLVALRAVAPRGTLPRTADDDDESPAAPPRARSAPAVDERSPSLAPPVRPRAPWQFFALAALLLLAAVLTRQIHLWLLAPLVVAAWLGRGDRRNAAARAAAMLLAAVPALLALAYFVRIWGGLAPRTQEWAKPVAWPNLSAVAMVLATFGALGLFFAGYRRRDDAGNGGGGDRDGRRRRAAAVAIAATVAAAAVAAAGATAYDKDAGRWSGLWNVARATPAAGDRSPAVVALAAAGGLVVAGLLAAFGRRERWVAAAALAGFAAAHAAVGQAWQRYYEPLILMLLALAAAGVVGRGGAGGAGVGAALVRRGLLATLAVAQAALTVASLR